MVGLWDSVTGFFTDLGDFFSGKDFFEAAGYAWNDMMKLAADVLTKNPSCRRGIVYSCSRRSDGKCGLFLYTHLFWICVFCAAHCGCDCHQCQFYQYRCNRHG